VTTFHPVPDVALRLDDAAYALAAITWWHSRTTHFIRPRA
jgi:hypothetical protein